MLGGEKNDVETSLFTLNWGASSLTAEDKLFFLSIQELYDHVGTYDAAPGMAVSSHDNWWLRTPRAEADSSHLVGGVNWNGIPWSFPVDSFRLDNATFCEARPAFNLDKDAVLMISDYDLVCEEGLASVRDTQCDTWRLTLKDDSRSSFEARVEAVSEGKVTVSYKNATTGTNERLSALVTDADGTVQFYGRILELDTADKASGTADIQLPEGFDRKNDTICVFNEQYHDGFPRFISYASDLVPLTLPDYAIVADVTALDFGSVPTDFTAVPAAKTVTLTNMGTEEITVNLPSSQYYTITAGNGFADGTATLNPGGAAAFTVQPNDSPIAEGNYGETLAVETDQTDVQCEIPLFFQRSNTRPTGYAQITLVNGDSDPGDYGRQMLLFYNNIFNPAAPDDLGLRSISSDWYDAAFCKLPENADPNKNTKNVVSPGKSLSVLIPAGTYDYFIAIPKGMEDEEIPGNFRNDFSFEAGKHYTITISENGDVTDPKVETILSIHTVTFDANEGTLVGEGTVTVGADGKVTKPNDPTREGYAFVGWYLGDTQWDFANGTVTESITLTAKWAKKYTVTAYGLYGSRPGFTPGETYTNRYAVGQEVLLPIGTREGYTFSGLTCEGIEEKDLTKTSDRGEPAVLFTMPGNDVTITVNWVKNGSSSGGGSSSGSSSGSSTYPVTVTGKIENGSVTVSPKNASKGTTVTVTVTPDKGYTLETLTVTDKNGDKLTLKDKGSGKYTFTMPSGKVTVTATFMDDNTMLNYFVDVKAGDFFYDAVLWAAQKGITTGVNAVEFGPNLSCTRAQIVTFLWRAAGSPEPKSVSSFADVPADSYYAKAVAWAVENGITGGVGGGRFDPNATCTRAQSVTFLYRALGKLSSNGTAFSDVPAGSYYAEAIAWAVENGVTNGIAATLFEPANDCTRAQIVTFLYRAYQGQ